FYFQNPQIYYLDWGGAGWTNVFSTASRNGISSFDSAVPIAMARNDINTVYVAALRQTSPNNPSSPYTYPNNNTVYKLTSPSGAWSSVFFITSGPPNNTPNQNIV